MVLNFRNFAKNIDMVFYMIPSLTYLSLGQCGLSNADLGLHHNLSKILPNIEHLDLSFNFLEGQLPCYFQNMTSLTFLDLSSYNLSMAWNSLKLLNTVPSLLELHLSSCGLLNAPFSAIYFNSSAHSNIQYLDLSHNSIEGSFPSELTNMTSLRVLDLSGNSLNSSIPTMPGLLKLDVSDNIFEQIELVGIWRQCYLMELILTGNTNYFEGEMIGPSSNRSECSQYALEALYLDHNLLNGSIPEFLGRLTNLRVLQLSENSFTSSIPKSLERLRLLEVLDLYYNALTGSIPESLGRLTCLNRLSLQSNRLTGAIPTSLGRLASLKELSLASNLLTGQIPVSIGQLIKLVKLDLSENSLEGVVFEAHFANLSMLKNLQTPDNYKLIFNISHEWTPPFQLIIINFRSCKIANGFPKWLQTQRKLEALALSNASLHGLLPTFFRKMHRLYELDLSYNKLSGSLINLPFNENTMNLLLQDNLFSGSLPRSLCRSTHLADLDVSRNRLSGKIPNRVGNLQNLSTLVLSSNRLSGVLPSSLGYMSSSLAWLKLNDNNFNGELPRDMENMRLLAVLDLGNNEFSGNIPNWIGENLTYLVILRLHKNNFTGGIPRSFCKLSHLHILDIAHNNLIGSIPYCFRGLSGMTETRQDEFQIGIYIYAITSQIINMNQVIKGMDLKYTSLTHLVFNMDLSSNKLTGEIPHGITALVSLIGLNLSHNHLSGSIPENIGNMKALNSLDLSNNLLTGTIPQSLADLNFLSSMNLSHNNLSGRIPTGNQLQTLTDPSIYAGNRDLCGAPLPNNCFNHENPPTTKSKKKTNNVWFYLDIMCGFATGFWGVIGVLSFKKQWRQKLFKIAEVAMDKVFVMVVVRVSKMKRGREAK
ncbi:uncharacterized protein LOC143576200 [Bidens hawaiensis]|uniref:uncharacterized protein LOC143576200 n=1 Tax=Bidens hawaiensis TaxID=980011 RepID=UPI00404938F7